MCFKETNLEDCEDKDCEHVETKDNGKANQ